jgi:hypothetical protein
VSVLDGWRYCPRCAAELERRDDHLACPACGFAQWANSVPGAQALVERDGRVAGGALRAADDIEELRWFAPDELPMGELAFPMFVEVLSLWRARQQHA